MFKVNQSTVSSEHKDSGSLAAESQRRTIIRILLLCHGNICRSAAAEIVLKQMAEQLKMPELQIASAATTREEIGNDIYPPMKKALQEAGYICPPHAARQTTRDDYARYDYLIGMDLENLYDMRRIYSGDPDRKISLLPSWAGYPGTEIEDPWYTRNFRGVLRLIEEGCTGLLRSLRKEQRLP